MKSISIFLFAGIILLMHISLHAQIKTLTLQPGPTDGKDALIRDDVPSTSYGNDVNFTSNAWTVGGNPCILRSLIRFDLSSLPAGARIQSAMLSLYCNTNSGIYQLQSGDNKSHLLRITEDWDESSVNWINQPGTTFEGSVLLATSVIPTQDYPDIDVTIPVSEMVLNPAGNYGWMIRLVTEELYRSMVFASSDHPTMAWRPKLVVTYTDCPDPVAHFNYQSAGTTVQFSDSSSSATQWYWGFGDGYYSDLQNPVHEYLQMGKYYACLLVRDSCGSAEFCDTVYVCESPATQFSVSVTDHMAIFSDLSGMGTSWYWSFGDGFYSDLQNPMHFFNDYGTYFVCLTSGNDCRQETWCDSVTVKNSNGIADVSPGEIKLYPNPAHDHIAVITSPGYTSNGSRFEIIDQTGIIRKIGFTASQSPYEQIDISDLATGIYYFRLMSENGVVVRKFLVCQ